MQNGQSFEEVVLARFDALDARLQSLENHVNRQGLEEKFMWVCLLAEIIELNLSLN
jgi:hypothetical protein